MKYGELKSLIYILLKPFSIHLFDIWRIIPVLWRIDFLFN